MVDRHRGWLNKFEGYAALAVFGAPVPLAHSASRALAAARELDAELRARSPEVRVGIGVSAGRVFAGNIGEPRRYGYTVIGDPVNEAARLSEEAKHGGGVIAAGEALTRAGEPEATRWKVVGSRILRGRETATTIAIPRHAAEEGPKGPPIRR